MTEEQTLDEDLGAAPTTYEMPPAPEPVPQTVIYAVDSEGRFIGTFVGLDAPEGSIAVDVPPLAASQIWDGEEWSAPVTRVPASITRRQCARELFAAGAVTGPEMVAMTATGTPPAMVEAVLAALPEAGQWIARADFAADTYERTNPLLVTVMTASGASAENIDDFFRSAAAR